MKDYFSRGEKDTWLTFVLAIAEMERALPKMKSDLLKEEKRCLSTVITLGRKAYNSVSERKGEKATKQLHRYAKNSNIQVVSKELSNVLSKKELKEAGFTQVSIDSLRKLSVGLIAEKCEDCNKSCSTCELFEILEDVGIDGYCIYDNCPYAFGDMEPKKENKLDKVKEEKKKSKRKTRKHKNRYDEDEEIYEYRIKNM